MTISTNLLPRLRASAWHLTASLTIAALAAVLVFGIWYPGAFRGLAGGTGLFLLIVGVDVALGPLLTFVVFDTRKGWPHLRRDLAVIAVLQLGGLIYGLHTVYTVRPVALVFEVDRFRVVAASSVRVQELPQAPAEYRSLPLSGPWMLSVRAARSKEEGSEALFMALDGADTGQRPSFWQPYDLARADAMRRARPVSALLSRYADQRASVEAVLRKAGISAADARFLPVVARGDWVALVDKAGTVVGYLPLDGFF
jgi:hypothetical protein